MIFQLQMLIMKYPYMYKFLFHSIIRNRIYKYIELSETLSGRMEFTIQIIILSIFTFDISPHKRAANKFKADSLSVPLHGNL